MPNWCSNSMTIYNPKVFKEKCIKRPTMMKDSSGDKITDEVFSFDNIIPQPDHMRAYNNLELDYPIKQTLEEEHITVEKIKEAKQIRNEFFTKNVMDYLHAKPWMDAEAERTGVPADSWYEWDCANWGTKWDVADDDIDIEELDKAIEEGTDFDVAFDTAWAPPIPVLEQMAKLGVEFSWSCEESGCQIYMSGETNGGVFSYGDDEPPVCDDDEEDEE